MQRTSACLLLLLIACGPGSTGTSDAPVGVYDAPTSAMDGSVGAHDAPLSAVDGSGSTGVPPAGGTPYVCALTLDQYCSVSSLCTRMSVSLPNCGANDGTIQCGSFTAFDASAGDIDRLSYYDSSGQLVAILDASPGSVVCLAGPRDFNAPGCGARMALPACPDARP